MTADSDDHQKAERIRTRAYMIWERDGRPDGHALAHWVKAKDEIEAEDREQQKPAAPPAAT